MSLIEDIKEITGIDITAKTRKQEVVFTRAIYYKIIKDTTLYSLEKIGSLCNQSHCQVIHAVNIVFPHAIKSKPHRELYYKLIGETDPDILLVTKNSLEVPKTLLEEILKDCGFWLKPNNKRQIEKLLEI